MTVILKSPGETNESALKRKKGKSLEHGEKELSILCQGTLKKKKKKKLAQDSCMYSEFTNIFCHHIPYLVAHAAHP